ncbi:hypothetical protein, partial [Salmonella enterica]|uniref:hypothetical protein n=1 Tax=Salmonella enterica TaxID=28901 RepID=UPI001EE9ABD3
KKMLNKSPPPQRIFSTAKGTLKTTGPFVLFDKFDAQRIKVTSNRTPNRQLTYESRLRYLLGEGSEKEPETVYVSQF